MMVQTQNINGLSSNEYDHLLAHGWFRSKDLMYRSDIICLQERVASVRHIRYSLKGFELKKRHRKLKEKNDQRFQIRILSFGIDDQVEQLYSKHIPRFQGFIHSNLSEMIFPFSTQVGIQGVQFQVFDGEQLVAVSFMDMGKQSAASILCVYDQAYSKYSLGIYTMIKEIEYLQQHGLKYYYPGYVLDAPSCFDYKLTLGNCQWMGDSGKWHAALPLKNHRSVAMILQEKMAELRVRLAMKGITARLKFYPYYTAAYLSQHAENLVKFPCYFLIETDEGNFGISYEMETDAFVMFQLRESPLFHVTHQSISEEYSKPSYELRVMEYVWIKNLESVRIYSPDKRKEMSL